MFRRKLPYRKGAKETSYVSTLLKVNLRLRFARYIGSSGIPDITESLTVVFIR